MYCPNCGAVVADDQKFCAACGAPVGTTTPNAASAAPAEVVYTSDEDIAAMTNTDQTILVRASAVLCYVNALFFLFIFVLKDKKYLRSHANNGLVLTIFAVGFATIAWIPILGWLSMIAYTIYFTVMTILGIINACKGKSYKMPILGGIKILK